MFQVENDAISTLSLNLQNDIRSMYKSQLYNFPTLVNGGQILKILIFDIFGPVRKNIARSPG
ncbi:9349_t:CDS:2 [Dentiscutata heterogama]|uniref:9349_t:CDS:1 n=1 Tax=Dentiscutata heterogama TaxID=1316150 RepID=A0ACA9KHJ9_9GLOM|nr:9349_t:CDS:2 [Dentiscutata heterogama]